MVVCNGSCMDAATKRLLAWATSVCIAMLMTAAVVAAAGVERRSVADGFKGDGPLLVILA